MGVKLNQRGMELRLGWLEAGFACLLLLALAMRLWELSGRAAHYDEAIHIHYAWRLAGGEGYIHSPWMHGPFQIEAVALIFRLLGDTDFTARLLYVLFGTALVGLPYFLRDYLGRAGALLAGLMLALSPALLYFSRFGRNDIIMAFWAVALVVLAWRYFQEDKPRYLYLAAAVLALMFATKETAYIVTVSLGVVVSLLALPQLAPLLLGRWPLARMAGPAGFLLLVVTLTLPQWSALVALFQGPLGLVLAGPDGSSLLVGAPPWGPPQVRLPVLELPWWSHLAVVVLLLAALAWRARRGSSFGKPGVWAVEVVAPALWAGTVVLLVLQPLRGAPGWLPGGLAAFAALGILAAWRCSWPRALALSLLPVLGTILYLFFLTPAVDVGRAANSVLPQGVTVAAAPNLVPVNVLVAGGVMLALLGASVLLGVGWLGGRWLLCAAIFYSIWITLYTTFFTNWAGVFSGAWQGMGYWIAQQEVARGNQPWYYYLAGMSVYEFLPVVFGALGGVYLVKKGNIFGMALLGWCGLTLLAYTLASEKMPWLLVNTTVPFILLAGMYLGALVEKVQWRHLLRRGQGLLLVLPPLALAGGGYLLLQLTDSAGQPGPLTWAVLLAALLLLVGSAYLASLPRDPVPAMSLAGLGVAALLLGLTAWAGAKAIYTNDDSRKEILLYAQGSAGLPKTYQTLERDAFNNPAATGAVLVDYDLWYPLQWYVRHQQKTGKLAFACFKREGESGWNSGCKAPDAESGAAAYLVSAEHNWGAAERLTGYRQEGPYRNLLWFPESYRRPAENRQAEGPLGELSRDWRFFLDTAASPAAWHDITEYWLFRELDRDWYNSEYYLYVKE
ncbi:MAG: TIGR03663 family protein [SAR202 cluster bacterium]|nr:TIGR03663 family protein [SAR202 cluster bacterium]